MKALAIFIVLILMAAVLMVAISFCSGRYAHERREAGEATFVWGQFISGDAHVVANDLLPTFDGVILIGSDGDGVFRPSESRDIIVVKYDNDGRLMWARPLGSPDRDENVTNTALDSQGRIWIVGHASSNHEDRIEIRAFVARLDETGAEELFEWIEADGSQAVSVAVNDEQDVVITGNSYVELGPPEPVNPLDGAFILTIDGGDGARRVEHIGGKMTFANEVAFLPDGSYVVCGNTEEELFAPNQGGADIFVCWYDSDGTQIRALQFGTPQEEYATDIVVDRRGFCYVVGHTTGDLDGTSAGGMDIFVVKYSPDGAERWRWQYGTPRQDKPIDAAVDVRDQLSILTISAGTFDFMANPSGTGDVGVIRLNGESQVVWTCGFDRRQLCRGESIGVDWQGAVFVCGQALARQSADDFLKTDAAIYRLTGAEPTAEDSGQFDADDEPFLESGGLFSGDQTTDQAEPQTTPAAP